jgi:phosphatidylserine decarboxylase
VKLAREGYPFIVAAVLIVSAAWLLALTAGGRATHVGLAGVCTALGLFTAWFFRDPAPELPEDPMLVVAPAEGRVIGIDRIDEPSFLRGAAHRISIFLSVFDVHVQRAPVSGTIQHKSYRPGKYAVAWLDKASDDNEQASLGIATPGGPVLVRQIAGLVARRIVTDPSEGERVERGERIGLIRFGSRVELFLPAAWDVVCAVGDRARVGATVLARQPSAVPASDEARAS